MTATEQSATLVLPAPTSPPITASSDDLVPRVVSLSKLTVLDDNFHDLPKERSLATSAPYTLISPENEHRTLLGSLNLDLSVLVPADMDDEIPRLARAKSKRSSSASNDLVHERDRFRARFHTLNTCNADNSILEERSSGEPECEVCYGISSKTKKLNVRGDFHGSLYALSESLSPLDPNSDYSAYLPPVLRKLNPALKINLKVITPKRLSTVFHWYFSKPLPPTSQMFPWLHGLHPENFTQRSFFAFQRMARNQDGDLTTSTDLNVRFLRPEDARFLISIEADPDSLPDHHVLHNTIGLEEVLKKIEFSRREVERTIRALVSSLFEDQCTPDVLEELVKTITTDCFSTGFIPEFLNLDPDRGISLRNFHIQVAKLARCADFVVYGLSKAEESGTSRAISIARLLRLAQITDEQSNPKKYNVYVLHGHDHDLVSLEEDLFPISAQRPSARARRIISYSKLSQLFHHCFNHTKLHYIPLWESNLQLKEKLETTVMSAASRLHQNVWVGNAWDHEVMMSEMKLEDYPNNIEESPVGAPETPHYCDPKRSTVFHEELTCKNFEKALPRPRAHWKLFVHCHNDAKFPDISLLGQLLFKYTMSSRIASDIEEVHHLDFPSSGSIGIGDCKQENLMSIVNTCKLLYLYSSSVTPGRLASLIYCSDGYTELSLLVFCYIMYAENISLSDAMSRLHLQYGRPFYIFSSDVLILRKLEILMRKFSPKNTSKQMEWGEQDVITSKELNEVLLGTSKPLPAKHIPSKFRLGYIRNDSDTESSESEDEDELNDTSSYLDRDWVEDVEGSIPSRILPYLYLGSLKHANSLALLSRIGIKCVISVGESLDWLHGHKFQHNNDIVIDEIDNGNIEHYTIKPKEANLNRSKNRCSVELVMKVNNLQDDGIDELSNALPSMLEAIDKEYKRTNGETKILVHCRVGVSRSATVVIAEVMRRLNLSLAPAYLYVRVRRLNIVIQPNLRFMYELFKWEEEEEAKKANPGGVIRKIDWFMMCREIEKLNLPYLAGR